jgi:hypothetical protein
MALVPFDREEIDGLISHYEAQGRRFESVGNVKAYQKQRRMILLLKEVLERREAASMLDNRSYVAGKEESFSDIGLLALALRAKRVIFETE